jgi:hypothetical protein
VSPVLIYMLTGETLAVDELFQPEAIQFGDDPLGIRLRAWSRLTGCGVPEGDDRGDRRVRRNAEVLAHPVVLVGSHRIRAAADAKTPRGDHHVLGDASRIETQAFVQKHDRDRDGTAIEIPRSHHRAREIVPVLSVLEDDEAPRLRVLAASRRAPSLKNLCDHVFRNRTIRVLADLAFGNDREIRVHLGKYPGGRRRGPPALICWLRSLVSEGTADDAAGAVGRGVDVDVIVAWVGADGRKERGVRECPGSDYSVLIAG